MTRAAQQNSDDLRKYKLLIEGKMREVRESLPARGTDAELLRELEQAERRLEDGSFGLCEECGEPIAPKRLAAMPWARLCASCQKNSAAAPD